MSTFIFIYCRVVFQTRTMYDHKCLKILKLMKIFGLAPIIMKPHPINSAIPVMIFLYHIGGIAATVNCPFETRTTMKTSIYEFLQLLMMYFDMFSVVLLCIVIFKGIIRKIKSWKILSELMNLYPENNKVVQWILFICINSSYLFIWSTEWINTDYKFMQCIFGWLHFHISHYITLMVLFFTVQFLIIIHAFYQQIYDTLLSVHETVKYGNYTSDSFNIEKITQIRKKYLDYYNVIVHQRNIFGGPTCILIMFYVNLVLLNVTFLLYQAGTLNIFNVIVPFIQLVIHGVSFFVFGQFTGCQIKRGCSRSLKHDKKSNKI